MQHTMRLYSPSVTRTDGWVNVLVFLVLAGIIGIIAGPILIFGGHMLMWGLIAGLTPGVLAAAHIVLAVTHKAEKMGDNQLKAWEYYQKMPEGAKADLGTADIDTFINMADDDANLIHNKMRSLVSAYKTNQEACKVEDARVLSLKARLDDRIDYYDSHTKELKARA